MAAVLLTVVLLFCCEQICCERGRSWPATHDRFHRARNKWIDMTPWKFEQQDIPRVANFSVFNGKLRVMEMQDIGFLYHDYELPTSPFICWILLLANKVAIHV